jgi:DNA-binding HxlR family transcriptional regulator
MLDVKLEESPRAVVRSRSVLEERWTLLVVREALYGVTRFEAFRVNLGIAPGVLSARLAALVEHGIMTREVYQEPGRRAHYEYLLTERGRELHLVVGALQQWGDAHMPRPEGPSVIRRSRLTGEHVRVGFVDEYGSEIPEEQVDIVRVGLRILYLTWLHWETQSGLN